jgi:hypothetical protein
MATLNNIFDWYKGGRVGSAASSSGAPGEGTIPGGVADDPGQIGDPLEGGRWFGTPGDIIQRARRIENEELSRYQGGLGVATDAYENARDILSKGIDKDLFYSKALDSAGARARSQVQSLGKSLGARGLKPDSGAGRSMLGRIAFEQEGALTGAMRDIEIADYDRRTQNAAINFQNALNLAYYQNSPVPGATLDASLAMYEGELAREGLAAQERMTREANEKDWFDYAMGIVGAATPWIK